MSGVRLTFAEPDLEKFKVERSGDYPQELRLVLRVWYHRVELTIPNEKSYLLSEPISLYLASSKGYIMLSNPNTGKKTEVRARIDGFWHTLEYPAKVDIISEPLSLQDIHEIDELLGRESVRLYWGIDSLGFLEEGTIKSLVSKGYEFSRWERQLRGPVHVFFEGPEKTTERSRQDFVKNVLEPADMLRREFIEVVVEPISEEELDKFPVEFREALGVLLEKQKLLLEALRKLRYATTTADYRGVIDEVWRVIEGLTPKKPAGLKVYQALELAFKVLPIAREIDSGALDGVAQELSETLLGRPMDSGGEGRGSKKALNNFSDAIFKYASALRHSTFATGSGRAYIPRPSKSDAEFAVLQAMLLLNYVIRTIKTAALRY